MKRQKIFYILVVALLLIIISLFIFLPSNSTESFTCPIETIKLPSSYHFCYLREAEQIKSFGKVVFPIESLCNKRTPAWAKDGEIIGYGYREDWNILPNGVFFYHRPNCYWCQKQIENFGEQYFTELKSNGYVIDCSNN